MTHQTTFCDGMRRRDFLSIGSASLFGLGVGLPQLLASQAFAKSPKQDLSLIFVFLQGGLSTIDTFDLKPDAPAEFRGEFQPIETCVPGVQVCEHLPLIAQQMDKIALVRSFTHGNSNHGQADHYMLTGYLPSAAFNSGLKPNNQYPAHGSIIARKLGPRGSIPPYVCLPEMHSSCGSAYLGATQAPFVLNADPSSPEFSVPDLLPPLVIDADRATQRKSLLAQVDRYQQSAERAANRQAESLSIFREKAFGLMTSPDAKQAFDLESEPKELRDAYGRNTLGQSCLLARRLVESGVRCVTVNHTNWDTHDQNFKSLKDTLLPQLDPAMSTLFRDLADRGRLDSTLVVFTGEFGRTPRINKNAGRDHWGPSFTMILGGGGIQGGRVLGSSDARAEKPASDPYRPEDLCATMYHLMGINGEDEFYTPEGRPVKIVNDGKVMQGLL